MTRSVPSFLSPHFRDWRDPKWTSVMTVKAGLDADTRKQRQILFGDNVIDIDGKSTMSLLVEEVRKCALTNRSSAVSSLPPSANPF